MVFQLTKKDNIQGNWGERFIFFVIFFFKLMLWEENKYYLGFYLNLDQNVFEELKYFLIFKKHSSLTIFWPDCRVVDGLDAESLGLARQSLWKGSADDKSSHPAPFAGGGTERSNQFTKNCNSKENQNQTNWRRTTQELGHHGSVSNRDQSKINYFNFKLQHHWNSNLVTLYWVC